MKLCELEGDYCIWKLNPSQPIPESIYESRFYGINKTPTELSIVSESKYLVKEKAVKFETGWKALYVEGSLDLSLTGILNSITEPLAQHKINIFAVSTFDTDYVLVKKEKWDLACQVLSQAGFDVESTVC